MSDYGVDVCTECGEMTDCLLPARFPHICLTCLFPPRAVNPGEQAADEGTLLNPARHARPKPVTLTEALETRIGTPRELTDALYADRVGRTIEDDDDEDDDG